MLESLIKTQRIKNYSCSSKPILANNKLMMFFKEQNRRQIKRETQMPMVKIIRARRRLNANQLSLR
jgi:hypothetical protein